MINTDIQVKVDNFDGPLALLLHLVQKQEIDIQELDIEQITQQYLEFLQKMEELNFDVAGEFLYMAATLLYIKSKNCVEHGEGEVHSSFTDEDFDITSKSQLIEKLEQLELFQRLGEELWKLPKKGEDVFTRPRLKKQTLANMFLQPMDLQELTNTMVDVLFREGRKHKVIEKDKVSIKSKLIDLKKVLREGLKTQFSHLLSKDESKIDKVVTFISLLELARLKKVSIFQNEDRGDIYVEVLDNLENFDVDQANGFDDPEQEEKEKEEELKAQLIQEAANTVEDVNTLH